MKTRNRKLQFTHKHLGKIKCEEEVQEAETLQEAVNWAGGESDALAVLNWAAFYKFGQKCRADANAAAESETVEEYLSKVSKNAQDMKPTAGRVGPSKTDKLSFADAIAEAKAKGEDVSGERLAQLAAEYGIL